MPVKTTFTLAKKKRIAELADIFKSGKHQFDTEYLNYKVWVPEYETLHRCREAINKKTNWEITIDGIQVIADGGDFSDGDVVFGFKDYNNTEIDALASAIDYVLDKE